MRPSDLFAMFSRSAVRSSRPPTFSSAMSRTSRASQKTCASGDSAKASRTWMTWAALGVAVVGTSACDGVSPIGPLNLTGAPTVSLDVSPRSGAAPLQTQLVATAEGSSALEVRFDFDGDGTFDTEFDSATTVDHTFVAEGVYSPVVEVRDASGATATASAVPPVNVQAPFADIDVDTNRDGVIDATDEEGEDIFTSARGAVVLSNVDDDDQDGERDILDDEVDGEADLLDMAQVRIGRSTALLASDTVMLRIEPPEARDRMRMHLQDDDGDFSVFFSPQGDAPEIDADALRGGDMILYVEVIGRGAVWDGTLDLTLEVERDGEILASDAVRIESAPVIFPDNTEIPQTLYVMEINDNRNAPNQPFFNRIEATLPDDVALFAIDEFDYYGDRWAQDNMQSGVQVIPTADGRREILNFLEAERYSGGYGLELLVPQGILGPDVGFSYPGGSPTSLNYGGNLEVTPPHSGPAGDFPLGRIVAGGGDGGTILGRTYADSMAADQMEWMNGQRLQGPVLEVSSEWLAVGHIDEYFLFVADTRSPADGGRADRPWRIVVASPDLAIAQLQEVADEGGLDTGIFVGRETETSVREILEDNDFLDYNDAVQARIDANMDVLADEMGLTEEDFIYVPVIYEAYVEQGYDFAVALNPGIQNLVPVASPDAPGVLYVPDPEGPRNAAGDDVWGQHTIDVLSPLGHQVELVDVFNSYHLLWGEAHCGTNVQRAPPPTQWWEFLDADNRGRQ